MDTVKLSNNLNEIKVKIAASCLKAGRNPQDIEIIAASKSRTIEEIKALDLLGVKVFGENKVQEFAAKYDSSLMWDIIGQLQSNKVKYVVGKVRLIHSVDRLSLVAEIDRQAKKHGLTQEILIQINTGEEENKGGIVLREGEAFAAELLKYENIRLAGVMAVTPVDVGEEARRALFSGVKRLYDKLRENHSGVRYLSMGMSDDYPLALECGSNMVRLGRVLFD